MRIKASRWTSSRCGIHAAILLMSLLGVTAMEAADEPIKYPELPNAKQPLEDVLSGGQPTQEALATAAENGYKTVVNLRSEAEMAAMEDWNEAETVAKLGMDYIHIPMAGAAGLTVENARRLADILAETDNRPLILHCASGNRVGGLLALKAFHVDGESAEDALAFGLESGLTALEDAVREHLADSDPDSAESGPAGKGY